MARYLPDAQVADGEVGRDGNRRGVVQQLHPPDQKPDRLVEGPASERRAAAGVRQSGRAFGVVERGRDEDRAREDQRERGQSQREGRGDAERVVDARADVAVARREERGCAQGAGKLGPASDHDPHVARAPAPSGDGVVAHEGRA